MIRDGKHNWSLSIFFHSVGGHNSYVILFNPIPPGLFKGGSALGGAGGGGSARGL